MNEFLSFGFNFGFFDIIEHIANSFSHFSSIWLDLAAICLSTAIISAVSFIAFALPFFHVFYSHKYT